MDTHCVKKWVKNILRSYLRMPPLPQELSHCCHMMGSVVTMIQDLGMKVIQISSGCTSICQPLDIGINKPFKACLQAKWEEFMIQQMDAGTEIYARVEWANAVFLHAQ
jgi:hypothetical protein